VPSMNIPTCRLIAISYCALVLCVATALAWQALVTEPRPFEGHAPDRGTLEYAAGMKAERDARPQTAGTVFGLVILAGAIGFGSAVASTALIRRAS
jgi:hypothetical protein